MANKIGEMYEESGSSKLALTEMAMGFFRGKVLCAAVRLGVADALATGPMTADELAAATKTNPSAYIVSCAPWRASVLSRRSHRLVLS
jgi:hypothetical protein